MIAQQPLHGQPAGKVPLESLCAWGARAFVSRGKLMLTPDREQWLGLHPIDGHAVGIAFKGWMDRTLATLDVEDLRKSSAKGNKEITENILVDGEFVQFCMSLCYHSGYVYIRAWAEED